MLKHILYIVFLFFISICSYAQVKETGYYIQPSGDTVFSAISFKKGNLTPASVTVHANEGDIVLTIADVNGFGLPGIVHYRKRKITVHTNPIEYTLAPSDFSNEVVTKEAFVQVIESGTVSLYELVEKQRNYFFTEDGDGITRELIYRVKLNQNSLEEDNVYKAQLRALCTKYNVINRTEKWFANLSYNSKDIARLVQAINQESGVTNYSIKKQKVSIGIVAGINYTIWPSTFEGAFFTPSFTFNTSNQIKPLLGIDFNYSFPRTKGRFQVQASVLYSSFNFDEMRRDSTTDGLTSTTREELYKLEQKMVLVSLSPVIIINPAADVKFYLQPGISVGFTANNSNLFGAAIRKNYSAGNPSSTSTVIQNAIIDDKPFNFHLNLGSGVVFGRNKIHFSFLPPVNLINTDFFPPLRKGHLFLTYSFRIIN